MAGEAAHSSMSSAKKSRRESLAHISGLARRQASLSSFTATIEIDDPIAPTRNHKPGGSLRLLATSERLLALTADVAATGRFDALDQLLMELDGTADDERLPRVDLVFPRLVERRDLEPARRRSFAAVVHRR